MHTRSMDMSVLKGMGAAAHAQAPRRRELRGDAEELFVDLVHTPPATRVRPWVLSARRASKVGGGPRMSRSTTSRLSFFAGSAFPQSSLMLTRPPHLQYPLRHQLPCVMPPFPSPRRATVAGVVAVGVAMFAGEALAAHAAASSPARSSKKRGVANRAATRAPERAVGSKAV